MLINRKEVISIIFKDFYQHNVFLTFDETEFDDNAGSVFVITRFINHWVLTEIRKRGFEFPGGKVEKGETAKEAAEREVYEETGGVVGYLHFIGQYSVETDTKMITKNVYFTELESIDEIKPNEEVKGIAMMSDLPTNLYKYPDFSFMMKDDVLIKSIEQIKKLNLV